MSNKIHTEMEDLELLGVDEENTPVDFDQVDINRQIDRMNTIKNE